MKIFNDDYVIKKSIEYIQVKYQDTELILEIINLFKSMFDSDQCYGILLLLINKYHIIHHILVLLNMNEVIAYNTLELIDNILELSENNCV